MLSAVEGIAQQPEIMYFCYTIHVFLIGVLRKRKLKRILYIYIYMCKYAYSLPL